MWLNLYGCETVRRIGEKQAKMIDLCTHFTLLFYRYFYDPLIDIDINIFQNLLIDIDIFQNCLINIDFDINSF